MTERLRAVFVDHLSVMRGKYLPARKIGIMRAYTHVAMKYGCDAGIVNVEHQLYGRNAAPELVEMIEAYAQMDGSQEKCNKAMMLMGQYCQTSKK